MQSYTVNDHAKLNTDFLKVEFVKYMIQQYYVYIEGENLIQKPQNAIILAHDEADFDWFVGEFLKDHNRRFSVEAKIKLSKNHNNN
jgi:hypothetical protein